VQKTTYEAAKKKNGSTFHELFVYAFAKRARTNKFVHATHNYLHATHNYLHATTITNVKIGKYRSK